jgi:hypothetical protein
VEAAVQTANAEQLRTSAHALRGVLSAFSTNAAHAAEDLEQMGAQERAHEAAEPFQTLKLAVQALRTDVLALTIEKLRSVV